MPLNTQYNIITCAEPTWKPHELADGSNLNRVLDAFELSDFNVKTKYRFVNFLIDVDGYSPGKVDTVFHDNPDIHYSERRADRGRNLIVEVKVKRSEWVDLNDLERIEDLFFCRLFLACVHVCRHLKLNYRGLTDLLEQLAEVDRNRISLEMQNIRSLTYNKQTDKQQNELEVQFSINLEADYCSDPQKLWNLEDTIDQLLQIKQLGYVDGHDIGADQFTVFCHCFISPKKVLDAIKTLPAIGDWGSVYATLTTQKRFEKVQVC